MPLIRANCRSSSLGFVAVGTETLIEDRIVLQQLAVGLTEMYERVTLGTNVVLPYPANLQAALDQISLRAMIRGTAAPSSVVDLLTWAEEPLGLWPTPLVDPGSEEADDALLWFGELTPASDELAVLQHGDVVADARESATITAVRDKARVERMPEAYVAYRRFVIEHPVVDQFELAMVSADPVLNLLADLVRSSYEVVRPEWVRGGVVETCGSCGNVLHIVTGERRRACLSTLCKRQSRGGNRYEPDSVQVLRRDLQRYVGGPGRSEVRLHRRLSEAGVPSELWPDFDAYDLRVFDTEFWAVDVKAWVNPVRLVQHLNARPPRKPQNASRMFIVIADELASDGYIGSVESWRDPTWNGVTVASESSFIEQATARSKKGRS